MKNHITLVFALLIAILITSCTRQHAESIVASIGDKPLTLEEYEQTFARLNGGWERGVESTFEERKEFLDLLVRFKLKINDAYDSGLLEEPDIQKELEQYRKTLAAAYLIERELVEPALQEMYRRRVEELRASHILIRLPTNPAPDDTVRAYHQAKEVIQLLDAGVAFEDLALRYSEDPGVQHNKGDLYYFSGGAMVRPFEDAAFQLNVGEYTREPVRTRFGYHIIKLTERQPAVGGIRVSHIMKFAQEGATPDDTLKAYHEIHRLLDSLRAGADFAQLAETYSEDRQSAMRGGELGVIQRRSLPREFEEVAFTLRAGEISGVVRTPFGFHIIKVTEVHPFPSFEEIRDELRRQYQQRYMNEDHSNFIQSLKAKHNFKRHESTIEEFIAAVDTSWFADSPSWHDSLETSVLDNILFTVADRNVTAREVAFQIQANPEFIGRRLQPQQLRNMITRSEEIELIHKEAETVYERYPEFARQIDEYRDGILIYYIEQKRVWENIDLSEERLMEFYEENKERFTFPDRVNFIEIVVRTDSLAHSLYDRILAGEDMEELAVEYTIRANMKRQRGVTGFVNADRDELSRKAFSMEVGEVSKPFQFGRNYAIVKVLELDPARLKTFEEARGQVISEYQDMMAKRIEEEWIDSLRERYRVSVYPERLVNAFMSEGE